MSDISISVVLYKNDTLQIEELLKSIALTRLSYTIYFVDNSPTNDITYAISNFLRSNYIHYIFTGKNLGYGAGHNVAIKETINSTRYHLVVNPDVKFDKDVLEKLFEFMNANPDVGQLMPKVFYKNGALQKLCNPLPKPINLMGRRFFQNSEWSRKINDEYELKGFNYDRCLNVPNLSGCFMFLRCDTLKQTGFFDERYFMYMEDVDLCRRIHAVSKTLFYPEVSIIHGFEKESYSNKTLLRHHIQSAIKYFNKWGWVIDKQRDKFNQKLLTDIVSGNIDCD